jgi:hypothetical protein
VGGVGWLRKGWWEPTQLARVSRRDVAPLQIGRGVGNQGRVAGRDAEQMVLPREGNGKSVCMEDGVHQLILTVFARIEVNCSY